MDKKKLIAVWEKFAEKNDFKLNPNIEIVEMVAEGALNNEKNHGMKYCPCRVSSGDFEKDLLLVCPCNFRIQKTWAEKGECWCSLFVKRK
ncbi:MAG: ferredoxin:thioredoxin reductase [Candidatus Diapherotrites archaeon]|uniref:ferredoxin:thioredoxin reductase n=1 Tax=Candidatus Iainarchaeum sp. TaxID=3101447 RepID=A0A938YTG7_9ARCH|nr:ferredoxin:thioredoxin reductase [Candidatus Diapherotrites archaeon]